MKEFLTRTIFYLFFISLLIPSCSNYKEFDRGDLDSIAEFAIEAIKQKDTTSFLRLFDYSLRPKNDSIDIKKVIVENFIRAYEISKRHELKYINYDFIDALSGGDLVDKDSYNIYILRLEMIIIN
ncbi:hypothetical protein [Aquimarina sediminis]|uniref:hypothetical protein n=1 Tax=Aquimarina sediminis TaxID=2070536 RepID=UPI000CA018E3|nr:hypothetical protein [Aquimarina sediminis]